MDAELIEGVIDGLSRLPPGEPRCTARRAVRGVVSSVVLRHGRRTFRRSEEEKGNDVRLRESGFRSKGDLARLERPDVIGVDPCALGGVPARGHDDLRVRRVVPDEGDGSGLDLERRPLYVQRSTSLQSKLSAHMYGVGDGDGGSPRKPDLEIGAASDFDVVPQMGR